MIDIAVQSLLVQASRLPAAQVTPSTEVRPLTDTLPRVAWTLLDDPRKYTDSGVMALRRATYQLDVFADATEIARSVEFSIAARADEPDPTKRGLDGFAGTVDDTAISRVWFGSSHAGAPATSAIDGQNRTIARQIVEMNVVYRELLTQPNFTL